MSSCAKNGMRELVSPRIGSVNVAMRSPGANDLVAYRLRPAAPEPLLPRTSTFGWDETDAMFRALVSS